MHSSGVLWNGMVTWQARERDPFRMRAVCGVTFQPLMGLIREDRRLDSHLFQEIATKIKRVTDFKRSF